MKNLSEQNYGGTTYFVPESAKATMAQTIVYPPYMTYPGYPMDTSVAFMERTVNGKPNASTSFFVGEDYRQHILQAGSNSRSFNKFMWLKHEIFTKKIFLV